MTQVVPHGVVAPPATTAQPPDRVGGDTPALLTRLQVLAVSACVLFGVVAALLQVLSWQASGRAADDTDQVVRVQQIESSLSRADALATSSFLNGGIEPTDQRTEYDAAVAVILTQLTDAAEAQPADQEALAALGADVSAYTTGVTQARDNNRQQNPVASEYLGEAGTTLRAPTGAFAVADALIAANEQRASDEMDGQHPYWLLALGVVVLVVLWLVNAQLARRFHRRVNVGLAVAGVVVLLVTLVVGLHAGSRSRANDAVRSGPYTATIDEAAARTAANSAKAYESLRLINPGSGPVNEPLWRAQATIVTDRASASSLPLWQAYARVHATLAKADDAGDFETARALATAAGASGTTAPLDAFDKQAATEVAATGADATDRLRHGGPLAVVLAVLTLLGGLAAAGAAAWGVNQRRREFS